ncbi:hypothetical protein OROGR_020100 [Orobanche gracilis]
MLFAIATAMVAIDNYGVASIEEKIMENPLRWFDHVRRSLDDPVRRLESWGTSNVAIAKAKSYRKSEAKGHH